LPVVAVVEVDHIMVEKVLTIQEGQEEVVMEAVLPPLPLEVELQILVVVEEEQMAALEVVVVVELFVYDI